MEMCPLKCNGDAKPPPVHHTIKRLSRGSASCIKMQMKYSPRQFRNTVLRKRVTAYLLGKVVEVYKR